MCFLSFAPFASFCFKGLFEQKVAKTAKGTAREAIQNKNKEESV